MLTHYEVLGVAPTATGAELRRAYRAAVRRTHPDTGGSQRDFQVVHVAWTTLGDPVRRAAYDRWLLGAPPEVREEEPEVSPEQPWRRPSTGLLPTRMTVLGPVALSGLMLVSVLAMVGAVPAVAGAAYVLATWLAMARRRQVARVLLAGAWVLAIGFGSLAVLAPSADHSATMPLLVTMCTVVFATAGSAATYVQSASRSTDGA